MTRSFGRQITLTVCLIFLTLLILSMATQLLYRRLIVDLMAEDVCDSVKAAADMAELLGTESGRGREQLCVQLNYTARATGNDRFDAHPDINDYALYMALKDYFDEP